MNILITGANGQLGGELSRCLAAGRTALGDIPPALAGSRVELADLPELDVADGAAVARRMKQARPDVVFHCAAFTDVDGCEGDPDAAFRANAQGARNVAGACEEIGARLVHISTDYVFDGTGGAPRREWDLPAPQSVYGKSKLLGERYVGECCSRYFIVRTSWLYGLAGKNFVKTILRLARERGGVTVVDDQLGNPTNAADLAHHLLKLAATEAYGLYHCTGQGVCSWYEFAREFVGLAGIDCTVAPCATHQFPRPARRPAYSALDNMALRATVGDEMRHWREAIADYMKHYDRESGEFVL